MDTSCNLHADIVTEIKNGKLTLFKPGNIPHNKGERYLTDDTLPTSSAASVPVTRRMDAEEFSLIAMTKPTKWGIQSVQVHTVMPHQGLHKFYNHHSHQN